MHGLLTHGAGTMRPPPYNIASPALGLVQRTLITPYIFRAVSLVSACGANCLFYSVPALGAAAHSAVSNLGNSGYYS